MNQTLLALTRRRVVGAPLTFFRATSPSAGVVGSKAARSGFITASLRLYIEPRLTDLSLRTLQQMSHNRALSREKRFKHSPRSLSDKAMTSSLSAIRVTMRLDLHTVLRLLHHGRYMAHLQVRVRTRSWKTGKHPTVSHLPAIFCTSLEISPSRMEPKARMQSPASVEPKAYKNLCG